MSSVAVQAAPPGSELSPHSASAGHDRVRTLGKFLFAGQTKFWLRGVRYRPPVDFSRVPAQDAAARCEDDLRAAADAGINSLWLRGVPPAAFIDSAERHGMRLVLLPQTPLTAASLGSRRELRDAARSLAAAVRATRGHAAVLGHVLVTELRDDIVRWHGARRIESFVAELFATAKSIDPDCLLTCLNSPTSMPWRLPPLDFHSFDFDPALSDAALRSQIERLHNRLGDKPLVACHRHTPLAAGNGLSPAHALRARVRASFETGVAGVSVDAGTAEDRPDAAAGPSSFSAATLGACAEAFAGTPFAADIDWPRISIVCCSYNGSSTIRDTLEGIRALEYPDFEAIVINDGSTDSTPQIAAEYDVRLISTENRGLSNARNTGWQTADGDIVAYIDDDAYPDPHWLHYLALSFLRAPWVGVGGPNIAPAGDGPVADCVANAPGGPVHVLLTDTEAEHIPGCNMSFRRTALAAINGFDARYRAAGDDVDLCWRLQDHAGKIGFNAAAVVWHHRRNSVHTYWKQQQGYGKAEALLVGKWPERYNVLGHYAWSGRLYGKGLTSPLRLYASGIYGGRPDAAAVQSMHAGETGWLASLPLMPEWYAVVAVLGVLAALGLSWSPLLWFAPAALLALALPIGQALLSAAKAEFPTRHASRLVRARLRMLTALLHLLQPLARLKGRLQHGLTPWRSSQPTRPTWRPTDCRSVAGTAGPGIEGIRASLARLARQRAVPVELGGQTDDWDLEILGGALGSTRAICARLPGSETDTASIRIRSRISRAVLTVAAAGLVLGGLALVQNGWVAGAVMIAGSLALTLAACRQAGSAHTVLAELVDALGTAAGQGAAPDARRTEH